MATLNFTLKPLALTLLFNTIIHINREKQRDRDREINNIDATYHTLGWISSPLDNSNCVGFSQRSISFEDALLGI